MSNTTEASAEMKNNRFLNLKGRSLTFASIVLVEW